MDKWHSMGWELVDQAEDRWHIGLTFRREVLQRRRYWLTPTGWLLVVLTTVLIAATGVYVVQKGPEWRAKYEAWAAARSLKSGDLDAVGERLADSRGNLDFAYYFASKVTPRDLGDALATVAGTSKEDPLKADVDPHEYELELTDLAGVLALASHGTGDRAMPKQWMDDFAAAATEPSELYKVEGSFWDKNPFHKTAAEKRRDQDAANKSNLLLLLSRGYWSTDFLKTVTTKYYDFDRKEGDDAWPDADPGDDVGFAPAPNGVYLTDGIVALVAALSANSAASEWAFTDFQPDTVGIDDSDYRVGTFTKYLMFEHKFPEADGESIGMTAALTALSSAVDPESQSAVAEADLSERAAAEESGPMHDIIVLQALAHQLNAKDPCSWWVLNCIDNAAEKVWQWVKRWGHLVLDILTVATSFAPPPFNLISVAPATVNATWYAIEGDYLMAGLSLAAVVPGLGFGKLATSASAAKGAATATKAAKAAAGADEVAEAARWWRPLKPWEDCDLVPQGGLRLKYGPGWSPAQREAAAEKVQAIWKAGQRGELKKSASQRSNTSATSRYKSSGGSVPEGHDVDHTIELQLGGSDDLSNMRPLDPTVNRSIGRQIEAQLRHLDYGVPILGAAIC